MLMGLGGVFAQTMADPFRVVSCQSADCRGPYISVTITKA